ncbi:MAG TPA: choice-of-anchor Q domain-containing protein, partial [Candidatus Binatus sp.]|nr:choice-of-anchor Q domain-containing protein [Candidatus Binatus sp.]
MRPAVLAGLILLVLFIGLLAVRPKLYAATNTITVNSLLDASASGDGLCTLRKAIANANSRSDTSKGDCVAGTGTDTIAFSVSGTITIETVLPSIQNTLAIDGTGQTITIDDGTGTLRLFNNNLAGSLTLNNLTLQNGNTGLNGGAVFNGHTLVVTNSTFVGNVAASGGAIYNGPAGTMSVTNCTFSGNGGQGGGGAIRSDHGGTIVNSTFSGNAVGGGNSGAAILATGTALTVENAILANSTGPNCGATSGGSFTNGGGNISDDSSCGFGSSVAANGETIGDNVMPLLDPAGLQNNGGPTDTIALDANSPAINAILIANCPPTDQRGDPRPDPGDGSGACDSGAFESMNTLATPTPTSTATSSTSPTATATAASP